MGCNRPYASFAAARASSSAGSAARSFGRPEARLLAMMPFPARAMPVEMLILFARSFVSHWDTAGTDLPPMRYRRMLVTLLDRIGLTIEDTDDPEVTDHPLNLFAVRYGKNVDSYLASTQIRALAQRHGRDVEAVPVLFAGMLEATGNRGLAEIPAKREYMLWDVVRIARALGVRIEPPATHPFNPLTALRVAGCIAEQGARWQFVDAVYRAGWVEGQRVDQPEIVARIANGVGQHGGELVEQLPRRPRHDCGTRRRRRFAAERSGSRPCSWKGRCPGASTRFPTSTAASPEGRRWTKRASIDGVRRCHRRCAEGPANRGCVHPGGNASEPLPAH
jgi:protein-disulfide isomerase-like protein with CxxC motif